MWEVTSAIICGIITTLEVIIFGKVALEEEIQISKKKFIIISLGISLIFGIISLLFYNISKTLIIIILDIIFYKYVFKITMKKSTFLTFLYIVILLAADLIELFFVTKILHVSMAYCYNAYAGSVLGNITILILFTIITYIFKRLLRKIINNKITNNTKIVFFAILTIICTLMFFYTIIKEFRFNNNVLIYLIAIVVLLTVLFSLIKQTIENRNLTEKYEKILEFMTSYEKEIENQRILRHETKNEFLTIRGKINDKVKESKILAYIDEILKEKIEVKQEEYAKFGYLPANGIKGLCYLKTQEAQDKGLNTNINISKRIENSNIYKLNIKEQRDLGKILGVFLDNAIEASLTSKDKEFGIEAYLNLKKECQIIISNTYDTKIDTSKIGKKGFSTKGAKRGHGLLLVNHIVANNKIFEVKTNITQGLYIQTLTIKNK